MCVCLVSCECCWTWVFLLSRSQEHVKAQALESWMCTSPGSLAGGWNDRHFTHSSLFSVLSLWQHRRLGLAYVSRNGVWALGFFTNTFEKSQGDDGALQHIRRREGKKKVLSWSCKKETWCRHCFLSHTPNGIHQPVQDGCLMHRANLMSSLMSHAHLNRHHVA